MLFLSICVWAATAAAALVKPTEPSDDSFYDQPSNLSLYENGDIINYRAAPAMIRSIYFPVNVKNAWQFLVRSLNSLGDPNAIVTTVLEPYDANPEILLSYQQFQDLPSNDCAPSYSMLFNANMDTVVTQAEMLFIETALAKGWYVVVPDYEGVQGAFTAGVQSGHATLDSLRAALKSGNITGVDPDAKSAFWGYLGGTIASGWAAALQPDYAPELKKHLVGAALGGWVTNITLTAEATTGTLFAGLIPNAVQGLLSEYPQLGLLVNTELREDKISLFESAKEMCLITAIWDFMFIDFFNGDNPWATKGWGFFDIPIIQEVIENNTLALYEDGPVPEIPIFVFHGTEDEIVPFSGAQRAYDNYCDWGIDSLEFAVSNTTGHILELLEGSGAAIAWLQKMFDGEDPVEGCKRTVRETNILYPNADAEYRQLVRTFYSSVAGGEMGVTTRNITESSMVSKGLTKMFAKLIEKVGALPVKRDLGDLGMFKGLNDVVRLWDRENDNPWAETGLELD